MIPDYTNRRSFDYTNEDMQNLADEWVAASKNNLSSNQAQELYKKTDKLYSYLKDQEGSFCYKSKIQWAQTIEKIVDLSDAFINAFDKHEKKDLELLPQWIAEHTGLEQKHYKYNWKVKYQGAYDFFHNLVEEIKSIKTEEYVTPSNVWKDQSNLANVDSKSKLCIKEGRKVEIPDQFDIKIPIFKKIDFLEDLLSMRATSTENKDIIDTLLINQLNDSEISFEDLDIKGFEDIFLLLGERASELLHLNIKISNSHDADSVAELLQKCPNIESIILTEGAKITEKLMKCLNHLPRLKIFSFENFDDIKAYKGIIKNCQHLETIHIKDCKGAIDINILNTCKNLKKLNLTNCKYTPNHLTLKDCPIKLLEISGCFIENINCPTLTSLHINKCPLKSLSCPNLEEISIQSCVIKNPDILKGSIHLNDLKLISCKIKEIYLESCKDLKRIFVIGCSFKDLYFLTNLSSLTSLIVRNCPISSINVLQYLRSLEFFEIRGCKQLTRIEVLKDCKALKKVKLDVELSEDNPEAGNEYEDILDDLRDRGVEVVDL